MSFYHHSSLAQGRYLKARLNGNRSLIFLTLVNMATLFSKRVHLANTSLLYSLCLHALQGLTVSSNTGLELAQGFLSMPHYIAVWSLIKVSP